MTVIAWRMPLASAWRSQNDTRVAISVRDTGPGIPPDVLPHIFERFYRGAVSRSGVSTGLGLAMANELIEARGGAISVESQLGQGSVFTVTLRRPVTPRNQPQLFGFSTSG